MTEDRFVPTVGFVLAGFGLAAGLLPWTSLVARGPVESVPGVGFGLLALAGFAGRRYGVRDRRLTLAAGLGAAGLTVAASATILHPTATAEGLGAGAVLGFLLGVVTLGVAVADYLALGRAAFLRRAHLATGAFLVGVTGLFVGVVFSMVSYVAFPTAGAIATSGIGTAAFSIGLAAVAVGYLKVTDRDWSYVDLAWPTRRGWLYVIGGTVGMFLILGALGLLSQVLGLPSAEHGIIEQARGQPALLLAFVPLSWLLIGPGEELLSRNIVQKHLYDGFSRASSVLVGTAVFAAIHLPAYATGPPPAVFATLVQLFGISLVLGVVYERTENLVVPALVHGTYNAVQFAAAYVAITTGIL